MMRASCYRWGMSGIIIEWKYIPAAEGWEEIEPDAIAWVDIAAFDRAWSRTDQYIVPGGGNGQDDRYQRIGDWFAENRHCDMPFASLVDDGVSFTNGRHRFSWLRDKAVAAMPIQISPAQAAEFEKQFGTSLRASVIPA